MKVILQMMFGTPFDWTDKYFDNFEMLDDWTLKVFTPNKLKGRKNVEIIPMTIEEFDERVKKVTGIEPGNYIDGHAPHKLTSDYYPAYGLIMEDHIKGYDFWGHTNWDVVFGRIDHFLTDDYLKDCDIFADEVYELNGTFSIYRNCEKVNNLFKKVPGWEKAFKEHRLFGFDELIMGPWMATQEYVRFKCPPYYPWHGYDRLPLELEKKDDGSLYQVAIDKVTGRRMGKEIMFYHFSYTKKYPL
jgi:hypothetical protein